MEVLKNGESGGESKATKEPAGPSCLTCKSYIHVLGVGMTIDQGQCRAHPPQCTIGYIPMQSRMAGAGQMQVQQLNGTAFPIVQSDWLCGEWAASPPKLAMVT